MPEGISVGGLASGLDTNSIINGLIAIEQQRVTREETKKSDIELKLSTFNELKTKLSDFYTQAKEMDKNTVFNVFKTSSSDQTIATITGEDSATQGNFDVTVKGLASSLKVASGSFASNLTTLSLDGSFTISTSAAALKADPQVTTVQIDIAASDTLKDIAAKINRAKGAGCTASVLKMGDTDYRLMLTAVDEGTKAFKLAAVSGDEAKSIFDDGLGLVTQQTATTAKQSLRSDFDFRLAAGGPAVAATKISALFQSIGTANNVDAGDKIRLQGTRSTGTTFDVNFDITDPTLQSVDDVRAALEAAYGNATVSISESGEFIVTDTAGGATALTMTMSLTDAGSVSKLGMGSGVARTQFNNVIADGKKAFYLMNDMSVSSQTNRDNNTVTGTVFELKSVSTTKVKLTLDYDKDGIKKKVQTYLDSFNQLLKFLDEKSKIEVTKSEAGSSKKTQIKKGPFAGDSSILGLKSQLQSMMTGKISELTDNGISKYSSLAAMGITSEQKTNFLIINDTSFNTALDQDFEGVKRVFITGGYMTNSAHEFGTYSKDTRTGVYDIRPATGDLDTDKTSGTTWAAATISGDTNSNILNSTEGDSKGLAVKAATGSGVGKVVFVRGVAGQIKDFYDKITNFVDGFVSTTAKNYGDRIKDADSRIERLEKQVAGAKQRLTTQFANLELSISKLKSQSGAFASQLGR